MIAITVEANVDAHDYGALRLRRMKFRRASTLCKGSAADEVVASALVLRSPFAHAQSSQMKSLCLKFVLQSVASRMKPLLAKTVIRG